MKIPAQYKKLALIMTSAAALHFLKDWLVADGPVTDMAMAAVIALLAGKADTNG